MFPLLRDSLRLFRLHLGAFAAIILPFVVPLEVLNSLSTRLLSPGVGELSARFPLLLVEFAVSAIWQAAVVFYIASAAAGDARGIVDSWRLGIRCLTRFLPLTLLVAMLVTLGLLLLVAPGVIALCRFAFADFCFLLDGRSTLEAMKLSWDRTRGHMKLILPGFLLIAIVLLAPYIMVLLFLGEGGVDSGLFHAAARVFYPVLSVMFTCYAFRVYVLARGLDEASATGGEGPSAQRS